MRFAFWCYLCEGNINPFITNQSVYEKQNFCIYPDRFNCCYYEFLLCIPQQIRMSGQPDGKHPVQKLIYKRHCVWNGYR